MTQYNSLNVQLSNSQLSKLKSEMIKWNWSKLSWNVIGNSNDETNFPQVTINIIIKKLLSIHKFWGLVKLFQMVQQHI